jgi:hypothetical protein
MAALLAIPPTVDPGRSRAGTWPPVKVVRPVGRSTLTGGQNPAPLACGTTADGMAPSPTVLWQARPDRQRDLDAQSPNEAVGTAGNAARL